MTGIITTLGNVSNTVSTVSGAVGALGDLSAGRLGLAGLTAGAEAGLDIINALSSFSDDNNSNDWRVRLSLPKWNSFRSSPVLAPLKEAGGLVFPYTPDITLSSSAKYSPVAPTHNNYPFQAYEGSNPGTIQITAPMNVEDKTQALYWIAALHYCRSVTKMFTGFDARAGNPPPIVFLNGYGNYVFKNIPVAITQFQLQLQKDCDYIGCDVRGTTMGEIADIADAVGGLSGALGSAIPELSSITSAVSSVAELASTVTSFAAAAGVGGSTAAGTAYVPTKSSFTITLVPMYSRTSVRKFSLDRFVSGGYTSDSFGYV
jgi:hypothetical protein